ncbi:MAG: 2TM domain-containing protein [Flavobacteriaceae bacterium]
MKEVYAQDQGFIKAEKRVKDIKGFYTHIAATPLLIPFIIFINLQTVPQFQWFWFFIAAWGVGLLVHWFVVFGFLKSRLNEEWKQKKIKEIMEEGYQTASPESESDQIQQLFYIRTKKRVKEIKGFYAFLIVTIISISLVTYINLKFVPDFHFFWFVVLGMLFALFMMWLGIFGFSKLGLGIDWEQKKIRKIMEEEKKRKNESNGSY